MTNRMQTIHLLPCARLRFLSYCGLFNTVFDATIASYQPSVIVLQWYALAAHLMHSFLTGGASGADSLAGDPLGGFNLSSAGLLACVDRVLRLRLPTLVLGGGGCAVATLTHARYSLSRRRYVPANAARLWTAITAMAIGVPVSQGTHTLHAYMHLTPLCRHS